MRIVLAAALLAALAGCSEAPSQTAEPASSLMPRGPYNAASASAQQLTGNMRIERAGMLFDSGITLFTRTLDPLRGTDRIARDGDSYAAAAFGPSDLLVELRRVTEETPRSDGGKLCGSAHVEYIAIVYDARATSLTLLAFTGAEPPSPQATQSRICARLGYSAPHGARTREGVVL